MTAGRLSVLRDENPKGEYVIVIEPAEKTEIDDDAIIVELKKLLADGTDKKTAVNIVSERLKTSKNKVYKLSLSH